MSTVEALAPERFLLHNIGWQTYLHILEGQDERHIRVTYDRGDLELMTLSYGHEHRSRAINRLIETLTEELEIPIASAGSTTINREDAEKGLEPDECYYLRNEPRVRGKTQIDLDIDPPPDLAVEIDVSRSSLNRLGIYAGLGVPEVWRYTNGHLVVYHLQEDGAYATRAESFNFPFLPMDEVDRRINKVAEMDQLGWMRSVRAWIRDEVAPRFANHPRQ